MIPLSKNSSIKSILNGPDCHSADHYPIVSKAMGIDNLFIACGFNSRGIMSSGGVGKLISELIVDGMG